MTNTALARLRHASARLAYGLLIAGALLSPAAAGAQEAAEPPPNPPVSAATTLGERLTAVAGQIDAARERLAEPIAAIDVAEAEEWLAASPLERLSERAGAEGISEPERELWQQAANLEEAGAERVRGALSRAGLAQSASERLDAVQQRIDEMSAPAASSTDDAERPLSGIDQDIAALNVRRSQVMIELDQRRATLARLEIQLRNQEQTIEQLRMDREAGAAQAAESGDEDPALAPAREARAAAAVRRADALLIDARLDARSLPVRTELLRLEAQADELELVWIAARLETLQAEFRERSTAALRELTTDLQRLIEREPGAEQQFAGQIELLRSRIDQSAATQSRIRELQLELARYTALEAELADKLAKVASWLEYSGLTNTLGTLFLEEQRRLRALGNLRFTLQRLERELDLARVRIIDLELRASAQPISGAGLADDSGSSQLAALQARAADTLVQGEEALINQLGMTDERLRAVVGLMDSLEQTLNEALLWFPSHAPIGADWALRVPIAVVALLDPSAWRITGAALREVGIGRWPTSLLMLVVAVVLYRGGRSTGGKLRELAQKTRHRFTDSIMLTYQAIGWSVLRVLPIPVLLSSTGFRLEHLPETDPGVDIIAAVLWSAAIWWLAGHLLMLLISRNGVATVHFAWNPLLIERLRRQLKWYLPVQFLLIMCLALSFAHPADVVFDVFGRAALVASGATVAWLAWRLLAPNPDLVTAFSDRRRRFVRIAAVLGAGALIFLALSGYLLTVSELFSRAIDTVVVLSLVGLGYRLATRALILSETRLRIRRMREQREKAAAVESNSLSAESPDLPDPHLSIEDVNQQTRTLVRVTAGVSLLVGLFWVWADMLPALTWLDNVELWQRAVMVNGVEATSRVSLQDALLAIALTVLFVLGAKNLPGLVEILLSRATRMDGAGRYTIATLLRYVIMVVAVVSVFSLLGLRWAELQWMVAALTLGLGFGLQEVVANFVSGLIMLFERPVRVGDTITIGEYSGTVARIRTRATTIIDWDNREVVVPNKNFITERLINWTLSDTMTRIVLPIGVSYDADVDLVIETLLSIANEHPAVLKEPPPAALFLRFGDSVLHFELRVYVAQLRERMETTSALHRQIIKSFRELGIKIAFPQMDLHIRDVPPRRGAQAARQPGEIGMASR